MKNLLFLLILVSFSSCSKDETSSLILQNGPSVLGKWEIVSYENDDLSYTNIYVKVPKFDKTNAIAFEDNNVFISYDHGWCGTPPLCFATIKGEYELNDNKLEVEIGDHYIFSNKSITYEVIGSDTLKLRFGR